MQKGVLYIVATPIGNLSDFSVRAIDILNEVDFIACEDTRVTQILLNHYKINKKTISYHKFSEKERVNKFIEYLNDGKNIALVSDAGTPLISDPGCVLVTEAQKIGVKVIPVPGCCALITALCAVPNSGNFAFCGFFPQNETDIQKFKSYVNDFDLVFYESPKRVFYSLSLVKKIFGEVKVSFARELTKIYEEIKTMNVSDLIAYFNEIKIKGEFVLIIHKIVKSKDETDFINEAEKLLKLGYSKKDVSKIISTIMPVSKNVVYKKLNERNC